MKFNVGEINSKYKFEIKGVSYIGEPKANTAMYITKKIEQLLLKLTNVEQCLVFIEKNIFVPEELQLKNCFVFCEIPQLEYSKFVNKIAEKQFAKDRKRKYKCLESGTYIGENVKIGRNCLIEPGCLIGHDVIIGNDCKILSGSVIKNAVLGDQVLVNEGAVIGANGFTMVKEGENLIRIPTLGKVLIGNNVEIGVNDNISSGSGGDTIIEDYVKIDALVHVGHDVHIHKNVEITAGCVIGGFDVIQEDVFIGINSTLRNRIVLGKGCVVGMGATVTQNVPENVTVVGNPAKDFRNREKIKNGIPGFEKTIQGVEG